MIKMVSCDYCESQLKMRILDHDKMTVYSNPELRLDSSAMEIFITYGANQFKRITQTYIDFYYEDS